MLHLVELSHSSLPSDLPIDTPPTTPLKTTSAHSIADIASSSKVLPSRIGKNPFPNTPTPASHLISPSATPVSTSNSTLNATSPSKSMCPSGPEIPMSPLIILYKEYCQQLQTARIAESQVALNNINIGSNFSLGLSTSIDLHVTGDDMESGSANIAHQQQLSEGSGPAMATVGHRNVSGSALLLSKIGRLLVQIQLAATSTSILNFRPQLVAIELCLIEQSLFTKIHSSDFLVHHPPNNPAPSIQASTEFFNYLTRVVESTILEPVVATTRAELMHAWIKVASNLYQYRNMQTLKAIVSALGTPPITRLKRTWSLVPKKIMSTLKQLKELLSEQDNYYTYRDWMRRNITRPMIPFLGIFIHDMTYLLAAAKKDGNTEPANDKRVKEILDKLDFFKSGPRYSYAQLANFDVKEKSGTSLPFRSTSPKKKKIFAKNLNEDMRLLKNLDEESIGLFIAHWLLTRKWYSEKDMDELSLVREPRSTGGASDSAPTAPLLMSGSNISNGISNSADETLPTEGPDFTAAAECLAAYSLSILPEFAVNAGTSATSWGGPIGTSSAPLMLSPVQSRKRPPGANTATAIMEAIKGTAFIALPFVSSKRNQQQQPGHRRQSVYAKAFGVAELYDEKLSTDMSKDPESLDEQSGESSDSSSDWSLNSLKSFSNDDQQQEEGESSDGRPHTDEKGTTHNATNELGSSPTTANNTPGSSTTIPGNGNGSRMQTGVFDLAADMKSRLDSFTGTQSQAGTPRANSRNSSKNALFLKLGMNVGNGGTTAGLVGNVVNSSDGCRENVERGEGAIQPQAQKTEHLVTSSSAPSKTTPLSQAVEKGSGSSIGQLLSRKAIGAAKQRPTDDQPKSLATTAGPIYVVGATSNNMPSASASVQPVKKPRQKRSHSGTPPSKGLILSNTSTDIRDIMSTEGIPYSQTSANSLQNSAPDPKHPPALPPKPTKTTLLGPTNSNSESRGPCPPPPPPPAIIKANNPSSTSETSMLSELKAKLRRRDRSNDYAL
ncbi:hypothetical protein HK102_002831 [Quaeritorhiza haematococci]|nr:hypothetical protein HK102_002831 [Quaeritorhiza haematococci]